jgi:hypothetical protein
MSANRHHTAYGLVRGMTELMLGASPPAYEGMESDQIIRPWGGRRVRR